MKKKNQRIGMALLAPAAVGVFVFFVIPFCVMVYRSFWFGVGGGTFVKLQNYNDVWRSTSFQVAIKNTLRFASVSVVIQTPLSFFIASGLCKLGRSARRHVHVFLLPMVVPAAAVLVFVNDMFWADGLFNRVLVQMGKVPKEWLQSGAAFWVLVGFFLWKYSGYNILLLYVSIRRIPSVYFDEADSNGATQWQKYRKVVLPLTAPSLGFSMFLTVANGLKIYREAVLLGGNHPDESIYLIQHFLNNNFQNLNYQRVSAASVLVFILFMLVFALFYGLAQKGRGNDEK